MKTQLNDIRILRLAQMYEIAYEGFLRDVADRVVDDVEVRLQLEALNAPDHAGRIEDHLERLRRGLEDSDREGLQRAALLDVRDIERAAQRFFQLYADRVHDPQVVALFREIAAEDRGHVRDVEDILDRMGGNGDGGDVRADATSEDPERNARTRSGVRG